MSLVREAQATSGSRSRRDDLRDLRPRRHRRDVPHVMVYVTNDEGQSGYLIGDLDGNVLQTSTPLI